MTLGKVIISHLRSSAKGNRTPIARMKILSTNRYTMAPGAVSRQTGEAASAQKGFRRARPKKRAKVLLFFDIRKYFCIFFAYMT